MRAERAEQSPRRSPTRCHPSRGRTTCDGQSADRSALEGDLRSERFATALIQSAFSGTWLADALSEIGRFDQAIGYAEAIAEEADHPYTLSTELIALGLTHLRRADLPRATRVLERGLDLSHTWQIKALYFVAATLGVAYALAGQADEALQLIVGPLEEFCRRPIHFRPALVPLCAARIYLSAWQIKEAANHAREALALTRRLGARGSEAHALYLTGDVATTGSIEDAEGYYRQALALAEPRGMRPLNPRR